MKNTNAHNKFLRFVEKSGTLIETIIKKHETKVTIELNNYIFVIRLNSVGH